MSVTVLITDSTGVRRSRPFKARLMFLSNEPDDESEGEVHIGLSQTSNTDFGVDLIIPTDVTKAFKKTLMSVDLDKPFIREISV